MTDNTRLLFLAGYPRSGTTWFSNMINADPTVIYRHEFLGRIWNKLPAGRFDQLKYSHGLSDQERAETVAAILQAHPEADRPPFFYKTHLPLRSPRVHHFAWMAASALPQVLGFAYRKLYAPRPAGQVILIKETRSAANMDSILAGLQADACIFLFRHPCGAIASQLRGIASGKMRRPGRRELEMFYSDNRDQLLQLGYDSELTDWLECPVEVQLSAMWAVQNSTYIKLASDHKAVFVDYDSFYRERYERLADLFNALGMTASERVVTFLRESDSESKPSGMRDAGSEFYSVYRGGDFNTEQWRDELSPEQIRGIEQRTLAVYQQLQEHYRKGLQPCVA